MNRSDTECACAAFLPDVPPIEHDDDGTPACVSWRVWLALFLLACVAGVVIAYGVQTGSRS